MALYIGSRKVVLGYTQSDAINYTKVGYVLAVAPYGKKAIMLDSFHYEDNEQGQTVVIGNE